MFEISLICVGKLKEKFYLSAAAEYVKRLQGYCKFTLTELPEIRTSDSPSESEIAAALEKEAGMIKYFDGYCKNLYESYKSREKEIKHPDILKFIKDYEAYYKGGEE